MSDCYKKYYEARIYLGGSHMDTVRMLDEEEFRSHLYYLIKNLSKEYSIELSVPPDFDYKVYQDLLSSIDGSRDYSSEEENTNAI